MRILSRVIGVISVVFASLFVVAVSGGSAIAQQLRPDPSDPAVPVAATATASAFADYQPFLEQKVAPWKQVLEEVAGVPGAAGHAGHNATAATTAEPKETMPAPSAIDDKKAMARAKPKPSSSAETSTAAPGATITATGIVQSIDKVNSKVKLIHDPITALGWPKMTMFFRLKDAALAEQVKEGDAVQFDLEKSPSGYVISGFKKAMPDNDMRDMDKGDRQ
jgi:Cu/Ag efflux protein CusF